MTTANPVSTPTNPPPTPTIKSIEVGQPGTDDDTVVEGHPLVYNVCLTSACSGPTLFYYTLGEGGSTANADDYRAPTFSNGVTYDPVAHTVCVPTGVTNFCVTVPTVDDRDCEPLESLQLCIGGVSETGYILDNDMASTGGFAKGTEDTPLTLTWAEFHFSGFTGSNLGITINSLPANGMLLLNGSAVSTGQNVSKSDIDAGNLVFKPALNQSGEDEYSAAGVGNKLNDYAKFDFTATQNHCNTCGSAAFTVDIAPVADAPIGISTLGRLDIYLDPIFNKLAPDHSLLNWLTWKSVNVRLPSQDTDGSEYHIARISVSDDGGIGINSVPPHTMIIALPNGNYVTSQPTVTPDPYAYYDAATKEFVIDTDIYSKIYWPQYHQYNDVNIKDLAADITIKNITEEVNKYGLILDTACATDCFHVNQTYSNHSSPLILDLNYDGVHTLDTANGVQFDLLNQGAVQTGWADKHDGLLALDLNHDGQINSGAELFGQATQLADGSLAKDGFQALAQYDTNHDAKIDANDAIFSQLSVWVDANSDGITQAGELQTLGQAGVAAIQLASQSSTTIDNGNLLGLMGGYTGTDNMQHQMDDVWFNYDVSNSMAQTSSANMPQTALTQYALPDFLSAQHSLDTLLANAGLTEAPAAANPSVNFAKAEDAFMEVKNMDMTACAVVSHELMM